MLLARIIDGELSIWHGGDRIVDPIPAPPVATGEADSAIEDLGYWSHSNWRLTVYGWCVDVGMLEEP